MTSYFAGLRPALVAPSSERCETKAPYCSCWVENEDEFSRILPPQWGGYRVKL